MTTGGSDGIPQHSRWQRATLLTCRCVLVICGADHLLGLAYPGFVGLLPSKAHVITSGAVGSFTAETPARLTHIKHSSSTVVYYSYTAADPPKTLSVSVNHLEQWVKWSWITD